MSLFELTAPVEASHGTAHAQQNSEGVTNAGLQCQPFEQRANFVALLVLDQTVEWGGPDAPAEADLELQPSIAVDEGVSGPKNAA